MRYNRSLGTLEGGAPRLKRKTDCKEPLCEWHGPPRSLIEHQVRAHGYANRESILHRNKQIDHMIKAAAAQKRQQENDLEDA